MNLLPKHINGNRTLTAMFIPKATQKNLDYREAYLIASLIFLKPIYDP